MNRMNFCVCYDLSLINEFSVDLVRNSIMSSNVRLSEKNSGSESVMPRKTVPKNSIDIRTNKEYLGGKSDESTSSKQKKVKSNSTKSKNASTSSSGAELQVPKVSSSSSSCCDLPLQSYAVENSKSGSKISERAKRKSWYNVIYPSYKSRAENFKKYFKEVPEDERLVVDYSCALQREILVHGRMYVTQHYMCFHANIFGWETFLCLKWENVTAITKEKTALVIPNAILISTETEKYFITSFAARDKTYLMLFRIWQNALMDKPMPPQEIWQCVHNAYGEQLGLTSDDEDDYIDPKKNPPIKDAEPIIEKPPAKTDMDQSSEKNSSVKMRVAETHGSGDSSTLRPNQSKLKMRKEENECPTDASNSTDSEEENCVPFECTAECSSDHEGRQLVHTILPINVDSLLTMLFSKSKFFAEFHSMRKTTNMVYRDWVDNGDGTKTRIINLTVAVTQPVGPKTSNITEVQVMRNCSVPGQLYSIDIVSTNAGIPYADSFNIGTHYCLLRTVDDHTMLSVYVQINYTKSVWGVIKGFIEKNVWCGLENFYKDLVKALQSEYCIPPAKSKSRRTKRALSQKLSVDEDASKRSSLKSTTKTAPAQSTTPAQSTAPQPSSDTTKSNTMSTQCTTETFPDQTNNRSIYTLDMFSIFLVILIVTLVLLNLYLLIELYVLKHQQNYGIHIDQDLLDKLAATDDPNEMKERFLSMMNEQEAEHGVELEKWQGFIKMTMDLLQNVKEEYAKLDLDTNNAEKNIKDEF
ncbi:protein Aster-B-like isoform X2 [Sitodiplosis mosellana]|uniref:protein Aster-B-like isoform X2 n=1 Tax=Sitodiplosis mosellana TaxID=263140 RepID=UPI0024443F6A|nr:protein Aster-B-like isoform X2 [Sitodiplosis mosellana]